MKYYIAAATPACASKLEPAVAQDSYSSTDQTHSCSLILATKVVRVIINAFQWPF